MALKSLVNFFIPYGYKLGDIAICKHNMLTRSNSN